MSRNFNLFPDPWGFFFTFHLYCTQHHTDIGPIVLACLKYMKVKSKVDEIFTKSDR